MKDHDAARKVGILAAGLFLALATVSFAAAPDAQDGGHCTPADEHGMRGPPPPPAPGGFGWGGPGGGGRPFGGPGWGGPGFGGPGFGGPGGHGPGEPWGAPPYLHGLKLTEEQQDKVFSILYAAAPKLREQEKAVRKAHDALMELNTADKYDESSARSLVEAATKAEGQLMLLRLRSEHEILALLTPEQRKTLSEHRHEHGGLKHQADEPG